MQIRSSNIKNSLIRACATAAAVECYIQHSRLDGTLTAILKDEILRKVGTILTNLATINNLSIALTGDPENNLLPINLEAAKTDLELKINDLPGIGWLESLTLTCEAEFFFEALCCGVREACLKQQNFNFKINTAYAANLNKEINTLKQLTPPDHTLINTKERELAIHNERQLKNEVMERKKFEMLNNEKITPYFLSLVKGSKKEETLENITRDDGTEFENPADRKNFYKKFI